MKIKVHKITPAVYKNYPNFTLDWGVFNSKFGNMLIAFNDDKLAFATFSKDKEPPIHYIEKAWPNAKLVENNEIVKQKTEEIFKENPPEIEIIVKGTDFEMAVWEALVGIEKGTTWSYSQVAEKIGNPKAVRAVGSAVGRNNVGYFIPCHRVIKKGGTLGNYGGGPDLKLTILRDENAM